MLPRLNLVVSILFFSLVTHAQGADPESLFQWQVKASGAEVEQGGSFEIIATLSIADEHWVYKDMTGVSVVQPDSINLGNVVEPESITKLDPFENIDKEIYQGESEFRVPVYIKADAPPGELAIAVETRHQGCSSKVCYFPQNKTFEIPVTIVEGDGESESVVGQAADITPPTRSEASSAVDDYFSNGLFLGFAFIFLSGIATCATPCVFPLIPITVTIFGAKEAKSHIQAFSLALCYVIGIVIMYSSLGFAAASTGALFGQVMSNPWVIGFVAAVFIAMGASMLGAFELQLPSSWSAKLTGMGGKGFIGAFLMGLVAGIIAAPCTGPVLVTLLALVAKEADPVFGMSLLMVYAFGLGFPFLILGTFSGLIGKLPRSGSWMEGVKSVFGILLFAAALYFLKDVYAPLREILSYSFELFAIAGVLFVIGVTIGAVHLSFHSNNPLTWARKGTGVTMCVVAVYLGAGSLTAVESSNVTWQKNLYASLEQAKENNKPVMIDFYADWCTVCKEIEATTFSDEKVGVALDEYVTIKIDIDRHPDKNKIQSDYGILGLPFIYFYDSTGERLPDKTITGYIGPEEFLEHISDIK